MNAPAGYDQTKGELCKKCGWAMKFPGELCRCDLERDNIRLRKKAVFAVGVIERTLREIEEDGVVDRHGATVDGLRKAHRALGSVLPNSKDEPRG